MQIDNVRFGNGELPIEHVQELTLDATDVPFAEQTGGDRPMVVFQSRVVGVFGGEDEGAEEDAVEGPFLGLDRQVGFGTVDVDEGD